MVYFRIITSSGYVPDLIFKVQRLIAQMFNSNVETVSKPYWKLDGFMEVEFEIESTKSYSFEEFQVFFEKSIDKKPSNVNTESGWSDIEYYGDVLNGDKYFAILSICNEHITKENTGDG